MTIQCRKCGRFRRGANLERVENTDGWIVDICRGGCKPNRIRVRRQYKFDVHGLADLFGRGEQTIRNWIREGKFDPNDLKSLCELYKEKVGCLKL